MFQHYTFKSLCTSPLRTQIALVQHTKTYSARPHPYDDGSNSADFESAREWFSQFTDSTIPRKIAATRPSKSSGPGGQKVNNTKSKATTTWPMDSLTFYVPKILHHGLRASRYFSWRTDSIAIQSDTHRSFQLNFEETHKRLAEEIREVYKTTVPGVTSSEQQKKVDQLQKTENAARLRMKKQHSAKKRARSGGGGGDY